MLPACLYLCLCFCLFLFLYLCAYICFIVFVCVFICFLSVFVSIFCVSQLPPDGCKCMAPQSTDDDWQHAKYMPSLSNSLRCVVVVCFNRSTFKRLALLQAEARSMQW